jgi:hypothetical protein
MNKILGVFGLTAVAVVSLLVLGCSDPKPTGTESINGDPDLSGCDKNPAVQTEQDESDTCVVLNKHGKCRKHHKHHNNHKKPHPKDDDTGVTPEPEPTPVPQPCGMACFTTDANTIAHWTFDGMTGGVVPDQSSSGFNATPYGTPAFAAATCGNAISLSGSGQYLDVPNWNRLVGYTKVSFDVMFKINSMRNDGTAGGVMMSELINDQNWYPTTGMVLRIKGNVCEFAIGTTSAWQYLTDANAVSFGEWHHVSASFDVTTKTMTLQLDCNAVISKTYSGEFQPSSLPYFRIGSASVNPPSRFVNGAIDAVIIKGWKSAAPVPVPEPTPVPVPEPTPVPEPVPTPVPVPCGMACFSTDANTIVHWTFDGIENGLVPDQSSNGFNATPFGAPAFAAATCGNAISLSGSGQYLDAYNWNRLVGYTKVTYDVLFKINSMRDDGTASGDMLSELVNDSHWYPIGGAVVRVRNSVCQFAIASTSGWQHLTDVVPVSFGEWHHVAASFDQTTKTMTLQLDCNAPVGMTYGGTFVPSYVSYIRIGSCVVDPPSRFVNGAIDAIIIKGWK